MKTMIETIKQKILDNKQEFTHSHVIRGLTSSIKRWLSTRDNNKQLFVLLVEKTYNIELYHHFKDMLPKHTVIDNLKGNSFLNNVEYLCLDDTCLNDYKIYSYHDEVFYNISKDYLHETTNILTFIFFCVTNSPINFIKGYNDYKSELKLFYNHKCNTLDHYLSKEELEFLPDYNGFMQKQNMEEYMNNACVKLDYRRMDDSESYPDILE